MSEQTIRVRVTPGARKESVIELKTNVLSIAVKETAERGEANSRVQLLVAYYFRVPIASVRIQSGRTARNKTFMIVR